MLQLRDHGEQIGAAERGMLALTARGQQQLKPTGRRSQLLVLTLREAVARCQTSCLTMMSGVRMSRSRKSPDGLQKVWRPRSHVFLGQP